MPLYPPSKSAGAAGTSGEVQYNLSGALSATTLLHWDTNSSSLHIGNPTYLLASPVAIGISSTYYLQSTIQNQSASASGSSDFIATCDDGNDTGRYVDLGINSSVYSDPAYSITGPRDAYLYVSGGNIAIGTSEAAGQLKLHTGGTTVGNLRAFIDSGSLTLTGTLLRISGALHQSIPFFSGPLGTMITASDFKYDYTYGGVEATQQGSYLALAPFISGSGGQSYTSGSPPQEANLGQLWFNRKAGKTNLNFQGTYGADSTVQPHMGQDRVVIYQGNTNSNTITTIGQAAPQVTGTYTATPIATTNFSSSLRRTDIVTGATAGQSAGIWGAALAYWRGNATGLGGWYQQTRFIVAATAAFTTNRNTRLFCGMSGSTTLPTNVIPSTMAQSYGICVDGGGTNFSSTNYCFLATTGTAPTKVDTGIPMAVGDVIDCRTYCPPSGTSIYFSCQKLNPTGSAILAEWELSSTMPNFPANTTLFNNYLYIQTATSSTVRMALMQYYLETDY